MTMCKLIQAHFYHSVVLVLWFCVSYGNTNNSIATLVPNDKGYANFTCDIVPNSTSLIVLNKGCWLATVELGAGKTPIRLYCSESDPDCYNPCNETAMNKYSYVAADEKTMVIRLYMPKCFEYKFFCLSKFPNNVDSPADLPGNSAQTKCPEVRPTKAAPTLTLPVTPSSSTNTTIAGPCINSTDSSEKSEDAKDDPGGFKTATIVLGVLFCITLIASVALGSILATCMYKKRKNSNTNAQIPLVQLNGAAPVSSSNGRSQV